MCTTSLKNLCLHFVFLMASGTPTNTIAASSSLSSLSSSTTTESKDSRWFLTLEQIQNSPSRRDGVTADQELNYRQKAAYLIQDMGQKLRV